MLTTLRIALTTAALCTAGAAHAKPRRVVVLDFDGPRTLADTGRTAVVTLLGEQYDLVTKKKWEQARAAASKRAYGPQTWTKAAKASGVDAVIEGWVQDEGRRKVLNIAVREASTGRELDVLSFKVGARGISEDTLDVIRTSLDEVLEYIEGGLEASTGGLPVVPARVMLGARRSADAGRETENADGAAADDEDDDDADDEDDDDRQRRPRLDDGGDGDGARRRRRDAGDDRADHRRRARRDDGDGTQRRARRDDGDDTQRRARRDDRDAAAPRTRSTRRGDDDARAPDVAVADDAEANELVALLGPTAEEWPLPKQPTHVPRPSPRFQLGAGGYYASRSLSFDAEDPQDFLGVGTKGLSLAAAVYPFPTQKVDGGLSGVGFTLDLHVAPASTVTVQTDEQVSDHRIASSGWAAGVHYRHALGIVSIDGAVGYAREAFALEADTPLDVPDTAYGFFYGGAGLALAITERASVGFGAKYLYVTDVGAMSDIDAWYGPGTSSGFALDGNFQIPLPARLYVRGELAYRRITTEFDAPDLAAESAQRAADGTVGGTVHVGIQF